MTTPDFTYVPNGKGGYMEVPVTADPQSIAVTAADATRAIAM